MVKPAHDGTRHFWAERMSALALVPLSVWFMIELVGALLTAERADATLWFRDPIHALLMAVFAIVMFYHSKLGVQVIVEDYVHHEGKKLATMMLSNALHLLLGAASLAAIAHLHFIGI
jgi:succinate dehydrogenase / fumarate reductase membrane anchor subunit